MKSTKISSAVVMSLLGISVPKVLADRCVPVSVLWQVAATNVMRCGEPGVLEANTYYSTREDFGWFSKMPNDANGVPKGTALSTTYRITTYPYGIATNCPSVSSNWNTVSVSFPYDGDFSSGGCTAELIGPCSVSGSGPHWCTETPTTLMSDTHCGLIFSFQFWDCTGSATNWPVVISNAESNWYSLLNYSSGGGCSGIESNRWLKKLSHPFTVEQFAENAMGAVAGKWQTPFGGRQCLVKLVCANDQNTGAPRKWMEVRLGQYFFKLKTESGVNYLGRWRLRKITATSTNEIGGGSWEGEGTGTEITIGPFPAPVPALDESFTVEVFDEDFEIVPSSTSSGGNSGGGGSNCRYGGNCSLGGFSSDAPGDGVDRLRSASFQISLGAGDVDNSAGVISMQQQVPSASLATPSALRILTNAAVTTVTTNGNVIDVAAPTMLARIAPTNSYAYWIHCFTKIGGSYQTNSPPFISHLLINPNGATDFNTLQHIRFTSSGAVTNEFTCETNTLTHVTWRLISGNNLKGERLVKIWNTNNTRLESYSIFNPINQQPLFAREKLFWTLQWAEFLLSETIDPGGLNLMTTNIYDSAGRLLTSFMPDGSWLRNEYETNGVLLRTVRPLMNQGPSAAANDCRVTEYGYASVSGSPDSQGSGPGEPRSVTELIQGQFISKTMFAYSGNNVYTRMTGNATAAWEAAGNEATDTYRDSQQRVTRIDHPDGTQTRITYSPSGISASGRVVITENGWWDSGSLMFSSGSKTISGYDGLGQITGTTNYDIKSGKIISAETYSDADIFARRTKVSYLDGSSVTEVRQDCCQSAYSIDPDGVATTNIFDALNRLVSSVRLKITNSTVFDAADRPLVFKRTGSDGSTIVQRGLVYDSAGRVIRETNALQGVTTYSNYVDMSGQSVRVTTYPDNGLRTEVHFRDGQLAMVTNTAIFPVQYLYAADENGEYSVETKLNTDGTPTSENIVTYFDFMGRPVKNGPGGAYRESFYNNKGQLWKEVDADGVTTLYTNNALGERAYTVTDSNRNNIIDFSGLDRITQTTNDVVSAHGVNVRRTRTYVWGTNNSPTPTLLTTFEVSTNGLKTWQTNHSGAQSVVTSTETQIPTSANAWTRTVTQTLPDSSTVVSVFRFGRLLSVTRKDSTGAQIGATTHGYDAHGRQNVMTDARNGSTTFTFNNADQVVTVTTPAPGNGAPAQTTTTVYDKMLRAVSTIAADNGVVTNEFYPSGLLKRTSGARTYPVEYTYDYAGRMKTMKTWREFGNESTAAITTWNYDAVHGRLANKRYADNYGPDYTYTAAGRLQTRQWARSVGANRVTTTYTYNNAGEINGISYNDGFTPAVTLASDRRGQTVQTIRNGITTTSTFNEAGLLQSENYSGGTLNGLSVTNVFDALLRRTSVSAKNGTTVLSTATYAYDNASRLLAVTDGGVNTATYSYVANSPLVGQIVFKNSGATRMTTTKTYDRLNRLSTINNQPSTDTPVSFSYDHNNANQRTRRMEADGSYWRYEYDDLGQVTFGKKYWSDGTPVAGQQFEYAFDDIGNRTSTKAGGDENGGNLRSASYSANSLNQYTSRTVPGVVDVFGVGRGTVTVNSQSTYRKGEYFRKEVAVGNTAGPVQEAITVTATDGSSTSQSGTNYVPKTPEAFGYDRDGNLTNDGRWHLTWDAENRLVQMTTIAGVPASAERRLDFEYDVKGRRVRKKVYDQPTGGTLVLDNKFLYDGWNLISELNGTNNAVIRSYVWGSDLSHKMQGAGGVGGLLSVLGTQTCFTGYDANGNVEELVSSTDGVSVGQYEYGAFGETVRISGLAAMANPVRFSTKYIDEESAWAYFGLRYLNPNNGSWLSRDPITERGGQNLYTFLGNASINRVDLLGLYDFRGGWALPPSCSAIAHAGMNSHPPYQLPNPFRPNPRRPSAGNQLFGYLPSTDLTEWFEENQRTTITHWTAVNLDLLTRAIKQRCLSGADPTALTGTANPPQLITPAGQTFGPWGANPLANELPPDDMGWWHGTRTVGRYVIHLRNIRVDRTYVTCVPCGKCFVWQGDIEITDTPGVNPTESPVDALMSGVGFQTQSEVVTIARWRHSGLVCCDAK